MQSQANNIICDTSWTVANGSLQNFVTFESSLSVIDDESSDFNKSPLILHPLSPDHSSPCEITINFGRKHEVLQIYVRSTGRVFELYYATDSNRENEYLCTVKCGVAARDGEVLRAATVVEEIVDSDKGNASLESVDEKHGNGGENLICNDDNWVEVKASGSVSENSSLSSSSDISRSGRRLRLQDLYEATAEITDANPCTSITLRLLSLQNKNAVCIDEVYVFADPVNESDKKVGPMENSSRSSLMAMLMPSILQMSKTKSVDKPDTDIGIMSEKRPQITEAKLSPSDSVDRGNRAQQEGTSGSSCQQKGQLEETVSPVPQEIPHPVEIPQQFSVWECKIDQLVSRVSRIEDLFLRFEDSMMKPIKNIDDRLQRVEQQLEMLTKKSQYSGSLSGTKISAPEFSFSESETNSLYNSGSLAPEINRRDSLPAVSSIHTDVAPISENFVVSAPEFSNSDDDEEEDAVDPAKESPKENQKHSMSIEDALASALAGFLSSTSVQSPRYSKTLSFKAPEFPNDEGYSNEETSSPKGPYERFTEPSPCLSDPERQVHQKSSFSSLSNLSSSERLSHSDDPVEAGEEVIGPLQNIISDEKVNATGTSIGHTAGSMPDMTGADSDQVTPGYASNREVMNVTGDIELVGVDHLSVEQVDDGVHTAEESIVLNELNTSAEVSQGSDKDVLQNDVEFSGSATPVDFETSILEVKFTSQGNLNTNTPLEALLEGLPDLTVAEVNKFKEIDEDHDSQLGNFLDLITLEELEAMDSSTGNLVSVHSDYCLTQSHSMVEDASRSKNE